MGVGVGVSGGTSTTTTGSATTTTGAATGTGNSSRRQLPLTRPGAWPRSAESQYDRRSKSTPRCGCRCRGRPQSGRVKNVPEALTARATGASPSKERTPGTKEKPDQATPSGRGKTETRSETERAPTEETTTGEKTKRSSRERSRSREARPLHRNDHRSNQFRLTVSVNTNGKSMRSASRSSGFSPGARSRDTANFSRMFTRPFFLKNRA